MRAKLEAAVAPAPAPVKGFCNWSPGSDAGGIGCDAVAILQPGQAVSSEALRWLARFARERSTPVRTSEPPLLGQANGLDVSLHYVFIGRKVSGDEIVLMGWSCGDQAVTERLDQGEAVPEADIGAAACSFRDDPAGMTFSLADALGGPN